MASMGSKLDSRSSSNLISTNILDGNGVKAMPGSIPAPYLGSSVKKKKIKEAE